jgi:GTPase SAR1 family protein
MLCACVPRTQGYFAPKQQSTIGAFFLTKKIQLSDSTACKLQIWDTAGQERFVESLHYQCDCFISSLTPGFEQWYVRRGCLFAAYKYTLRDCYKAPMYYRNASAAIVCFDITSTFSVQNSHAHLTRIRYRITDEESFNMMKDWVEGTRRTRCSMIMRTTLHPQSCSTMFLKINLARHSAIFAFKYDVLSYYAVLAIACNKADLEAQRVVARARTEQYARQVHAILYETSAKENFGKLALCWSINVPT